MNVIEFINQETENDGSFDADIERIKGLRKQIDALTAKEDEYKKAEFDAKFTNKGFRCMEKLGISTKIHALESELLRSILRIMEMIECDLSVAPNTALCFNVDIAHKIHAKWQRINEERFKDGNEMSALEHAHLIMDSFEPNFLRFLFALLSDEEVEEGDLQQEQKRRRLQPHGPCTGTTPNLLNSVD